MKVNVEEGYVFVTAKLAKILPMSVKGLKNTTKLNGNKGNGFVLSEDFIIEANWDSWRARFYFEVPQATLTELGYFKRPTGNWSKKRVNNE